MNLYPPLVGARIRVREVSRNTERVVVEMKLTWWNKNFARTHFGGSLYMMIDPFYALMIMQQLGPGYIVWDREATIHFRSPGRSLVRAVFEVPRETIDGHRRHLIDHDRLDVVLPIQIHDEHGTLVAEASKSIHIKRNESTPRS